MKESEQQKLREYVSAGNLQEAKKSVKRLQSKYGSSPDQAIGRLFKKKGLKPVEGQWVRDVGQEGFKLELPNNLTLSVASSKVTIMPYEKGCYFLSSTNPITASYGRFRVKDLSMFAFKYVNKALTPLAADIKGFLMRKTFNTLFVGKPMRFDPEEWLE